MGQLNDTFPSATSITKHGATKETCRLIGVRLRPLMLWAVLLGMTGLLSVTVTWGQKSVTDRPAKKPGKQYEIHLPSRTFTPQPEISGDLTKRLEGIIAESRKARAHLIVQLYRPPEPDDRNRLVRKGVTLLEPINRYTWYASADAIGAVYIQRIQAIRWADLIPPEDKLAKKAQPGAEPFTYQLRPSGRIAYAVLFHKDVTAEQVTALKDRIDIEFEDFDAETFKTVKLVTVTVLPGGTTALANADIVAWVEPVRPPIQKLNRLNAQPLSNIDTVQTAPFNLDGTGVAVGTWEFGATVYADHPDLTPRVIVEPGQTADNSDHAASVAGTLGGSGIHVANAEGMAPNVTIASWDSDDDLNEIQRAAASTGAPGQPTPIRISNHSYAFTIGWYKDCGDTFFLDNQDQFGLYNGYSNAIDNIVRQNGLVAVFGAGNNRDDEWNGTTPIAGVPPAPPRDCTQAGLGVDANCIGPMGSAKNVITVGAMDGATQIAPFSSFGPTLDGRIKPDLMAQGVDMLSLACNCFDDMDCDGVDDVPPLSAYPSRRASGTSLSAPVVTGVAALVLQDANNLGITLTPAQMKALLVQTAQDVRGVGPSTAGPDFSTGWGIVDAEAAVTLLRQGGITRGTLYHTDPEQVWSRPFSIPEDQDEMHVTLAWDDYPGSTIGQVLINDLDLRLIAPDGTVFTPWILDPDNPGGAAVPNGGNDAVNNVEQVSVGDPMAGVWLAKVSAAEGNLPQAPQVFGLAGPVGLTIVKPTQARSARAGTSTDGNNVFVRLSSSADLNMALENLTIEVGGDALEVPDQVPLHSVFEHETWLVIRPGARPEGCYDLTVRLVDMPEVTDTAPMSLCYDDSDQLTMDRVLAIDRTTSMLFDSLTFGLTMEKMNAARNAGLFFVYMSNDQDGIGAVSFQRTDENGNGSIAADELSDVEYPFTLADVGGDDRRPVARGAILGITPGLPPGGTETSLGAGLLEAKAMLDAHARADSEKVIVIITDGKENFPPYWARDDAGDPLKPDFAPGTGHIRIDAVSIGLDAEHEILQDMTETTGGNFYHLLEGTGSFSLLSRLASVFKFIDEDNRGAQRFYYKEDFPETSVGGEFGETVEGLFTVEPHLDWMTAAFHWNIDDAATDIRLIAPDGTEHETNRRGAKHVVYYIPKPNAGVWRYRVTVVKPMAEFFAAVSGPTLLTARLRVGETAFVGHGTWSTPLRVWIADNRAVLDAEVKGTVRRPDKIKLDVVFRDNGTSHDGASGDGVYGASYDGAISGPYAVDLVAAGTANNGESFERYLAGTFLIPGEPDSPKQVGEDPPGRGNCPQCDFCGGSVQCCWLWFVFIIALIATLVLFARYWCNRDIGLIPFLLMLGITLGIGWWLLKLCAILWCWFLLSIALAIIVAGLIALFTPIVPCIGWRNK